MKEEILCIASDLREGHITGNEAREQLMILFSTGKSLQIGDVQILLRGLEHIGMGSGDEQCDELSDYAMDTLTKYRYSIDIH